MDEFTGFTGLSAAGIKTLREYFAPTAAVIEKNDYIVRPVNQQSTAGILLSGTAYLAVINKDSQRRILDYFDGLHLFGRPVLPDYIGNSYYILARSRCTVAFMDHTTALGEAAEPGAAARIACALSADTARHAYEHTMILSQHTLRNKLTAFFECCRERRGSSSFPLPLTLSELADYLAVDRSAMMREIRRMKDEGLIESTGKRMRMLG